MSMPPLQPVGGATPPAPAPAPLTADLGTQQQNPWAMSPDGATGTAAKFARDKFLLNQKVLSLGSKYTMFDELSQALFHIDRPVLKLKAHIGVYEDEAKTRKVLSVDQERFLAINAKFTVKDENGNLIGSMERAGWMSMLRRTWEVRGADGLPIVKAMEDSWWKAIMRRVPYLDIVGDLIRTNFVIVRPGTNEVIGEFIRRYSLTDKYVLDMTKDPQRTLDRRLCVALAIVLDNAEAR